MDSLVLTINMKPFICSVSSFEQLLCTGHDMGNSGWWGMQGTKKTGKTQPLSLKS